MKKNQKCLFIIFVFTLIFMFGCYEIEDYESTLIVDNLPVGKCYVQVYHGIDSQETQENIKNGIHYIALANGTSPFDLIWYGGISSGIHFVKIELYPTPDNYIDKITKITTAQFSEKGDATIDWKDMIDYYPYLK